MAEADFHAAVRGLEEAGLSIREARHESGIMGGWLVVVEGDPHPVLLAWDGRDRLLVVQQEIELGRWSYPAQAATGGTLADKLAEMIAMATSGSLDDPNASRT